MSDRTSEEASAVALASYTVLLHRGGDRYEVLAHNLQAESKEHAAQIAFDRKHKANEDSLRWAMLVLTRPEMSHIDVALVSKVIPRTQPAHPAVASPERDTEGEQA